MEERKFKWFVHELTNRRPKFKILDVQICKGEHLISRYFVDRDGLFKFARGETSKIKHFLINLIEQRSPIMKEFQPNRVLALSYHERSMRILSPSSILEIPSQRVHSLKFRTIHLIPAHIHSFSLYKVRSDHQIATVSCEVKRVFHNGNAQNEQGIKDTALLLSSFVYKTTGKFLLKAAFDIIIDQDGRAYLLKVNRMTLQFNVNARVLESFNNYSKTGGLLKSPLFLEMMRKTFDKKHPKSMSNEVRSLKDLLDNIGNSTQYEREKEKTQLTNNVKLSEPKVFFSPGPTNRKFQKRLGDKRISKYRKDAMMRKHNSALQTPLKLLSDR